MSTEAQLNPAASGRTRDVLATPREAIVPTVPLGEFHLLTIGIDRYLHCPSLQTAVNGAREVGELLVEQYGFHAQCRRQLLDGYATREAIIETLRDLARQLKGDDSLLIFYAGHGHLDEFGLGHWVPVEASLQKAATLISNADIKNILGRFKARHILLVSDSCFAGDFFREAGSEAPVITDEYVRMAFAKASRQVLTSGGLEPVADGGAERHSVFTWFLLQELRESRQPYLVPSDLFARIKGGVAVNARQRPLLGVIEGTLGEERGEFVLFRGGGAASPNATIDQGGSVLPRREECEQETKNTGVPSGAPLAAAAGQTPDAGAVDILPTNAEAAESQTATSGLGGVLLFVLAGLWLVSGAASLALALLGKDQLGRDTWSSIHKAKDTTALLSAEQLKSGAYLLTGVLTVVLLVLMVWRFASRKKT